VLVVASAACDGGAGAVPTDAESNPEVDAGVLAPDADLDTIPRFSTALYLDLDAIERISRFRSGIGHDFADSFETCRSMKHYFCPRGCTGPHTVPWTSLVVSSPVSGTVTRLDVEQTYGMQIHLTPAGYPAWDVRVFHVTPVSSLHVGGAVAAGEPLGTHASENTMSDLAVQQERPDGFRLVSYLDTLAPAPLAQLVARGVPDPAALIITAEDRAGDPLACQGEVFLGAGSTPNWIDLP